MYFVEQCGFTPFRKQYLAKMMPLVATWRAIWGTANHWGWRTTHSL